VRQIKRLHNVTVGRDVYGSKSAATYDGTSDESKTVVIDTCIIELAAIARAKCKRNHGAVLRDESSISIGYISVFTGDDAKAGGVHVYSIDETHGWQAGGNRR